MSEAEEQTVGFSGELEEQQTDTSSSAKEDSPPDDRNQFTDQQAAECAEVRTESTESTESTEGRVAAEAAAAAAASVTSSPQQFKKKKFFVLRPGTLNQAIKDIEGLVEEELDGAIRSFWLMAEVDHWNNEKERIVLITENSLLIIKYDFVMFNCDQVQRIPLNYVDRISHGTFSFPKHSLLQRSGDGVRVFWDRLREPSFISRWNPFATDFPFITFTYHPVRNTSDTFESLCNIHKFREQLKEAAERLHVMKPVPGKANGVLVLNQALQIEAYVGLMSFLGNTNKLGYCMARGNIGF